MNPEQKQFHSMRWVLFWVFVVLFVGIVICTALAVFFRVGSPSEVEREFLFKGFLGEIGASVVALFYAIFRIRRGRSQDGDFQQVAAPTVAPSPHEPGRAELAALVEQIASAGVSRFIQSRDHYARVREAATVDCYVDTARKEVVIVSINLMTGVPFDGLCDVLTRRLNSDNAPLRVTISLLNPWREHLMAAIAPSVGTARLSESIQDTLRLLLEMRQGLSQNGRGRLMLRVHNAVPFASAIMLDPDEETGRVQIETKPYKAPLKKSFAIEFRSVGGDCLYQTLRDSYRRLVGEGDELDPRLIQVGPSQLGPSA